jgi:AcrR family transcriptional regulator
MRADARRNYDRLVAVAGAVVAEQGAAASLEEIARRAGVGSATLHRHFPSRYALLDAVFRDRVDGLCAEAAELLETASPGEALETWLRAVVTHASRNRGLAPSLMAGTGSAAHARIVEAGTKLLVRAQRAGAADAGVQVVDLLDLVNAVSLAVPGEPGRADRLVGLIINGLRGKGD